MGLTLGRNKYNLSCHNMFISSLIKGMNWFEVDACAMLTKLKICMVISKKPRVEMIDEWGLPFYQPETQSAIMCAITWYLIFLCVIMFLLFIFVVPSLFPEES